MTLAERLAVIRAEYESACAEMADLRRRAASKAGLLSSDGRDRGVGEERLWLEIAELRDRADAISGHAGELKEQITEMEAYLRNAGGSQFGKAAELLQSLRERFQAIRNGDRMDAVAQDEMRRLRAEYLRARAEELAKTYVSLADQLMDTAMQLKAVGGLAEGNGNPASVLRGHLEIPLPLDLSKTKGMEIVALRMDEQRIRNLQESLNEQLDQLLGF